MTPTRLFFAPDSTAGSLRPDLPYGEVCAIHQPNLFPRLVTLAKLFAADYWIVLDDVQFAHRDYHTARASPRSTARGSRGGSPFPPTCHTVAPPPSAERVWPIPPAAVAVSFSSSPTTAGTVPTGRRSRGGSNPYLPRSRARIDWQT